MKYIEKSFKFFSSKGVSFDAYRYRRKEESKVGADIAGFIKISVVGKKRGAVCGADQYADVSKMIFLAIITLKYSP